jgi:hypothetical protein
MKRIIRNTEKTRRSVKTRRAFSGVLTRLRGARGWIIAVTLSILAVMSGNTALAVDIGTSKLATGTEKLIKDVTSWLLIVAPLVTVVAVIYYLIRKSVSDEMDQSAATRCC